jgi:hypothetical protein
MAKEFYDQYEDGPMPADPIEISTEKSPFFTGEFVGTPEPRVPLTVLESLTVLGALAIILTPVTLFIWLAAR